MVSFSKARAVGALLALGCLCLHAEDYSGPKPPKADLPYLLLASRLVPTEDVQAKAESRKNGITYVIPGAASPAKTPLAEPIFIFLSKKITADTLQLFHLEVNGANREVYGGKKNKGGTKPLRLAVTQVGDHLYRIESYETLEPGEYSLSPNGSNEAFCFAVY